MLQLHGRVTIDVRQGTSPGSLVGDVNFVTDDGASFQIAEAVALSAGTTLNFGPVAAQAQLTSEFATAPTPKPPAGKPPAAAARK